jgi:type VI secretion system protein ImpC
MPSSIELNIGHVPAPRRSRDGAEEGDDAPLRVVVVGDFSGRPAAGRPPLGERRGVRVDVDNLDAVFARFDPEVEIAGLQDHAGQVLRIGLDSPEDLSADALLARLPATGVARPAPAVPAGPAPAGGEEDAAATMRRLLGGSVPAAAAARPGATGQAPDAIDSFIRRLVDAAPAPAPAAAAAAPPGSDAVRAALLRRVLRDPAWRHLECAWRGVDSLVRRLDTAGGRLRVDLIDARADELLADLVAASGEPQRSALAAAFKGDGRGCAWVVSLEEFGPGLQEQALLGGLASLAVAHGARLLAGAAPALAALAASDAPEVLASAEARVWHALRASELASRVGLTFPRLLARLPYGPRHETVEAFPFDELADLAPAALHDGLVWRSAALDVARLLVQEEIGEPQGDALTDLPAFVDRSADEPALWPVAEAWLGEREADRLRAAGFIVLLSDRRRPSARVLGWNAIAASGADLPSD